MAESHRILLVDDDPTNLAILEEILETEDYVLATARSGDEALRIAADFVPDLFLLDIMMPGMDGYETCKRLRQVPLMRFAKVILVSAKAMVSERLKGYEAGADDYITKPFDHTELLAKVRVFLRLKSSEEINQLKTDFLTLISHETRTPLTSIIGPAEILASDEVLSTDDRQNLAGMVIEGAARMRRMFEDAMILFSFKSGQVLTDCQSFDLRALAQEVIDNKVNSSPESGVRIHLRAPAELHLTGDMASIRTILGALLNRAITSDSHRSEVTLWLTGGEREVEVSVPFRCQGDARARLNEIFDVFHVSDVKHHGSQVSLELPLIREIAQYLGGSVAVESPDAEVTQLTVRLPRAASDSGEQAA